MGTNNIISTIINNTMRCSQIPLALLLCVQNTVDINLQVRCTCVSQLDFFRSSKASLAHRSKVILFGICVQGTLCTTVLVCAVWGSTKVFIACNAFLTKVANFISATACDLVTSRLFDETLLARRTPSNFRCRNCFFHCQATFGQHLVLHYFITPKNHRFRTFQKIYRMMKKPGKSLTEVECVPLHHNLGRM
jgi:hypothetical protein